MGRRWVPAVALGGLWWWAILRVVLRPEQAGLVEGAVAAGGWGLSLLPVHVASVVSVDRAGGREGAGPAGGRARSARPGGALTGVLARVFTRAWRRRRSGGGSDRS
ncbi:hypothetical protein CIB93_19705 [Streptomyces sp. WZ.A104]|uniref:hypothetical protein n=1 Tax=Streptomyces sp. WZ.A104 TaxID=2023771 RepID=UPI000BBC49AC|nr:hypothetical protein [Streptomyces sp. WZ.A104]PCG84336.1 hypothetical protein CIB93_19705 [Streptomyces sp. WZ.A104]